MKAVEFQKMLFKIQVKKYLNLNLLEFPSVWIMKTDPSDSIRKYLFYYIFIVKIRKKFDRPHLQAFNSFNVKLTNKDIFKEFLSS